MTKHLFRYPTLFCCVLSLLIFSHPAFSASSRSYFFNMSANRSTKIEPFTKWTKMLSRYGKHKHMQNSNCDPDTFPPCAVKDWNKLIQSISSKSLSDKLNTINAWSNNHPYIEDMINWGIEDYWETPYEFLAISGDCEDYAIIKYYSLRAMGIPAEKLRIMIVQDLNLGGIIHAVLGVYDGDELLILDNQIKQVTPAMRIFHYRPVYGINENAWWSYHPN